MDNILTNSEILIMRKVRDIDHMVLCDGFQYGIIAYRKGEQLVRRPRSMETWRFVMDLEATIKADIEAEQEMQAFEEAMWAHYQAEEAVGPLCEGCHRTEEMCICGGVPDEPVPGWPPTAQETVRYQQVMVKPDEF